jgi:hypothetical protein
MLWADNKELPMSSKGRPRSSELRAEMKLSLKASTVARVDLALMDPLTRKPRYGARSILVEGLLEEWLSKNEADPAQPPLPLEPRQ